MFAFAALAAQAQTDSAKQKPQLKLSINYNSGLNYYGRTDSLRSRGIFPMVEFWANSKLYVSATPIFVSNKAAALQYAGTVGTIGYQNISPKWFTNFYILKPFYKTASDLPQSALKAQSGLLFSRLSKVLNVSFGADVKWSNALDAGATAGIDHAVSWQRKQSIFVVDPGITFNGGTQRFSRTYITKKQNNNLPLLPGNNNNTQTTTQEVTGFNLLSYEVSAPFIWTRSKLQTIFTPAYVVPKNLQTVPNRPDLSETGKPMFYSTLSVKYTL